MTQENWNVIAKKLSEELDNTGNDTFNCWLQSENQNQKDFDGAKKLWDLAGKIDFEKKSDVNTEEEWQKLQSRIRKPQHNTLTIKYHLQQQSWPLVAASAVVIALLSMLIVNSFKKAEPQIKDTTLASYNNTITTTNSTKILFLPDSSKVILNKNTSVTFPANFNSNREITLTGEAFFDVKHNDLSPFTVTCQNTRIRDLGTSFTIKGYENDNEISVNVRTGEVEFYDVNNKKDKLILKANDRGSFNKNNKQIHKTNINEHDNDWWDGNNAEKKIKNLLKNIKHKNHKK